MLTSSQSVLSLQGTQIAVQYLQHDSGPSEYTLVFLHDALGSIDQWKQFPSRIVRATGQQAIVFDRQGHGQSTAFTKARSAQYLHQQALEILPLLMEQLTIQKPILIGHSDGGSIALLYGAHYPVAAIVSLAAHIYVEPITLAGIEKAGKLAPQLITLLQRYHGEKAEALFQAWQKTWLSDDFRHWSIEEHLPAIQCPVLAIQGEGDEYASPLHLEDIVQQVSGPSEALLLSQAKHMLHLEHAERLSKEISRFILQTIGTYS
ncbi:MAG: alpha/beta hydrolase [Bacteroidota bacterium]